MHGITRTGETQELPDTDVTVSGHENTFHGIPAEANLVPGAFEAAARRHPEKVAVECGGVEITYSALNQYADRVAGHLRVCGAGPEVLVGVLLERSAAMLAGLLGILKAGAAYLPIDPHSPPDRINFMLADANASLLLTQRSFEELRDLPGAKTILIEDIPGTRAEELPPSRRGGHPGDLAYVIYTSGSSGKPKGVEIEHRGLSNFLASIEAEIELRPDDVVAALSSPSFDISVLEFFLPLCGGATLAILPRAAAGQGERLRSEVERVGATVMLATPATWQLLVNAGWQGNRRMRAISGGESMSPALARFLAEHTRGFWNHYGPTETTIAATTYRVNGTEARIPIGKGLPNTRLYALDGDGREVEPGTVGELHIGGLGVARGYRNRGDLTTERFITIEAGDGRERVYRTGDMVKPLPDGNFEFVGRADNQIKIRGFRVELEEIEAALAQHPSIRENAVVAEECGRDDKRLIAYIVADGQAAGVASELRTFLKEKLPAYMIPSSFIVLENLPLNGNGKVDRQGLRARTRTLSERSNAPPGPADAVESELLSIWRRTLGFHSVGITDNFFEIGGHSLLAAKLAKAIGKRFETKLPISVLFQAPTIQQLAQLLRDRGWSPSWSPLVPISKEGVRAPVFCVHPIGGNVLSFQALSLHLGGDFPVYGLQARGLDNEELPHDSVEAMAADYVEAVREAQETGPYFLAGYSAGGLVAFEMARQLTLLGETIGMVILFDSYIGSPPDSGEGNGDGEIGITRHIWSILSRRLSRFQGMSFEEKISSVRRNFSYYGARFLMDMRIRRHLLLTRLGIPTARLRHVEDAFALAVRQYVPTPLPVNALLFRADKSDGDHDPDPAMGWQRLIQGNLSLCKVPGDHFTILYEPYVRAVARELTTRLEKLEPKTPVAPIPAGPA